MEHKIIGFERLRSKKKLKVVDIFLVVVDNFNEFGRTVPLKKKTSQKVKDSLENILISSKTKPKVIESDEGKEFVN